MISVKSKLIFLVISGTKVILLPSTLSQPLLPTEQGFPSTTSLERFTRGSSLHKILANEISKKTKQKRMTLFHSRCLLRLRLRSSHPVPFPDKIEMKI